MSKGPESRFIASIHRLLKGKVYAEKMHNPYRGGTADVWYSGKHDCWIEYKYIAKIPRKGRVVPDLSELQKKWLKARWSEGRRVHVVVGYPKGAVVFSKPSQWEAGLTGTQFEKQTITRQQLADWIAA